MTVMPKTVKKSALVKAATIRSMRSKAMLRPTKATLASMREDVSKKKSYTAKELINELFPHKKAC